MINQESVKQLNNSLSLFIIGLDFVCFLLVVGFAVTATAMSN